MPNTNIYKSIAAVTLMVLFFATIVSRDFYHLLGHKDEVVCSEHDNSEKHIHELDKCTICDHNFSAGNEPEQYFIAEEQFTFISYPAFYIDQNPLCLFFQNPDSRGSPFSA